VIVRAKITPTLVANPPLPERGSSAFFWDDGFGLAVRANGKKRFIVQYRADDGATRRITLKKGITLAAARSQAGDILAAVAQGHHPLAERQEVRQEARIARLIKKTSPRRGHRERGYETSIREQLSAAKKFLSFIERGIEPACYLYRHYHPNGDLLYVGISLWALKRQQKHAAKADWRNLIHRIVIEPFETREEALAAEEAAIRLEFPRFNKVYNGHRNLHREIARMGTIINLPKA